MNQIISGWIGTYTPNNQYSVDGVDVIYYDSKKIANDLMESNKSANASIDGFDKGGGGILRKNKIKVKKMVANNVKDVFKNIVNNIKREREEEKDKKKDKKEKREYFVEIIDLRLKNKITIIFKF